MTVFLLMQSYVFYTRKVAPVLKPGSILAAAGLNVSTSVSCLSHPFRVSSAAVFIAAMLHQMGWKFISRRCGDSWKTGAGGGGILR